MRWLTLYARSRQVPASFAAVVISAMAVWALAPDGNAGPGDLRLPTLALAAGVTAASVGLGGQDFALDRTAAIRWAPRRAVHVLLIGTDSRTNIPAEDRGAFCERPDCSDQAGPSRTDTMMILHIDPKQKRAAILSIPRDLVVT